MSSNNNKHNHLCKIPEVPDVNYFQSPLFIEHTAILKSMAKATVDIITILRKTADAIEISQSYQWGHMGACNCGFLAQQISHLHKEEIHTRAMKGNGDWTEQLNDYCPTSGLLMDSLISEIIAFGFDTEDLKHLERLSDKKILETLPFDQRHLRHNNKADVIRYLRTWSDLLENELINTITLPDLTKPASIL